MKTLDFDKVAITDTEMTKCVPSVVVEGVNIIPGRVSNIFIHPHQQLSVKIAARFPSTRNRIEAT